jgi:hypothetical protein
MTAMSPLPVRQRCHDDDACSAYLTAVRRLSAPHCGAVDTAHAAARAHYLRCNDLQKANCPGGKKTRCAQVAKSPFDRRRCIAVTC